ncbi:MAG: FAD-dependent oxidoreductase, partial [Pseudomonadales bacterium]|nr:FAD-dependent oxidoreductase [Pseudomonadales bacterium]
MSSFSDRLQHRFVIPGYWSFIRSPAVHNAGLYSGQPGLNRSRGVAILAEFEFDLFVIGGGSGGVRASRVAASLGARVACAEERYFGGTCVNAGCVPKKLFSYAAHFHDDFQDSRGFGWAT